MVQMILNFQGFSQTLRNEQAWSIATLETFKYSKSSNYFGEQHPSYLCFSDKLLGLLAEDYY